MKTTPVRKRDLEGRLAGSGGGPANRAASASRHAHGGKTIYGARVGILMLDTVLARIPGDIGNATTWPFPVLYKVVHAATPRRTYAEQEEWVIDAFVEAGQELVSDGADGLTTSCGFLSLFQDELAAKCGVPVAASSLMQVPFIERLLPPGKRVGVLTVSTRFLEERHLAAAGAAADTPLAGCENGSEFARVFTSDDRVEMDVAAAERDVLRAGDELMARHPEIGAVVLECTNLLPFAQALRERIDVPVYDAYSFVCWFHAGLAPRDFGHPGSAPLEFRER